MPEAKKLTSRTLPFEYPDVALLLQTAGIVNHLRLKMCLDAESKVTGKNAYIRLPLMFGSALILTPVNISYNKYQSWTDMLRPGVRLGPRSSQTLRVAVQLKVSARVRKAEETSFTVSARSPEELVLNIFSWLTATNNALYFPQQITDAYDKDYYDGEAEWEEMYGDDNEVIESDDEP